MKSPLVHAPLLAIVLAFPLACGGPDDDIQLAQAQSMQGIINGESCSETEFETAVAIIVEADVDIMGYQEHILAPSCTGTLIAPDVVLAAAHCFDASLLTMGMGTVLNEAYYATFSSDLVPLAEQATTELPADAVQAKDWIVNAEFDINSMNNVNGPGDYKDIALMFLASAVTSVEPELVIARNEVEQIVQGAPVHIAGWGQQTQTSGPFDPPPAGTVGGKMCATSFINEVTAYEMQIGGDADSARKCHGDSGGPTYMDVSTNYVDKRRVIGVTSHAYDQTDCAKGGVDTRVDYWLDWIDANMQVACDEGTRVWCQVKGIIPPSFYGSHAGQVDNDDDDETDKRACGCTTTSTPASWLLIIMGIFIVATKRRMK